MWPNDYLGYSSWPEEPKDPELVPPAHVAPYRHGGWPAKTQRVDNALNSNKNRKRKRRK